MLLPCVTYFLSTLDLGVGLPMSAESPLQAKWIVNAVPELRHVLN